MRLTRSRASRAGPARSHSSPAPAIASRPRSPSTGSMTRESSPSIPLGRRRSAPHTRRTRKPSGRRALQRRRRERPGFLQAFRGSGIRFSLRPVQDHRGQPDLTKPRRPRVLTATGAGCSSPPTAQDVLEWGTDQKVGPGAAESATGRLLELQHGSVTQRDVRAERWTPQGAVATVSFSTLRTLVMRALGLVAGARYVSRYHRTRIRETSRHPA